MIIENGTIQAQSTETGGGIDPTTGYPVTATSTWSNAIACQYRTNTFSYRGKTKPGEAFTIASYEILIEAAADFTPGRIRLLNDKGEVLGEFTVIEHEQLNEVGILRILV